MGGGGGSGANSGDTSTFFAQFILFTYIVTKPSNFSTSVNLWNHKAGDQLLLTDNHTANMYNTLAEAKNDGFLNECAQDT